MALNILFTLGIPYLPQLYGGLATNTHDLIKELTARGHRAAVLTRLSYGNAFGVRAALGMTLRGRRVSCDHTFGYPIYRTRTPWAAVDAVPRPDVAVVQDGQMVAFLEAFGRAGTPALGYLHGLEFEGWRRAGRPLSPAEVPAVPYLANSSFTATRFRGAHGLGATIVPPVFRPERYRTDRAPSHVTFINPVAEKGVGIALDVAAACPDIPFVFIKGWPLRPRDRLALGRRLRALPNVRLRERTSDMREVYATTRVLLAPSVWELETWGRVASEAHCSGIPVLASDRGGLPESVGPGGTIVPHDAPVERWVEELRRLWSDPGWYAAKSTAARSYAGRGDLDIGQQVDRFLAEVERAAGPGRPDRGPGAAVEA